MGFIINRVSFKASGERIDRIAELTANELLIGRDTACAIHLPDLAVDPKHARLWQIDADHLMIEGLRDQPFTVNGSPVLRREIDLARGAELGFGGHRLRISRDAASGQPLVVVERVEAVSEASEDKDYADAFTLKGLIPGKRISAWGFFLAVLAAALAWPIYSWATWQDKAYSGFTARDPKAFHADSLWMSGSLSAGHKKLEKDCQACHVEPFVAVRDDACLSCHATGHPSMTTRKSAPHVVDASGKEPTAMLVAARAAPQGFDKLQRDVGAALNRPAGRCVECHTEHEGGGAMQPAAQRFCADCHDGMAQRLKGAGMATALGNAADFGTDHPQFRPTIIIDPTTAVPTRQRALWTADLQEDNGLKFTHGQHLSASNAVAQMVIRRPAQFGASRKLACKDCHQITRDGISFAPVAMETSCAACHSLGFDEVGGTVRSLRHGQPAMVIADLRAFFRTGSPPRPANLGGIARRRPGAVNAANSARDYARAVRLFPSRADEAITQVFSQGGACYDCHTVTGAGAGVSIRKVAQNDRYLNKGWFSHGDHATETMADCLTCHVDADTSASARDLLVPGLDGAGGCRLCHTGASGVVKAGQPVARQTTETTCAQCHEYHVSGGLPYRLRNQHQRVTSPAKRRISWRIAPHHGPDHPMPMAKRG